MQGKHPLSLSLSQNVAEFEEFVSRPLILDREIELICACRANRQLIGNNRELPLNYSPGQGEGEGNDRPSDRDQKDLRYISCVFKIRQMLTETAKVERFARCNLLLCSLKHEAGRISFFSDEKIFILNAKVNRRNDHWLAHNPKDVP